MLKFAVKAIILGMIIAGIFVPLTGVFKPYTEEITYNGMRMEEFYGMPGNTIDVLYLGASTFHHGILPVEMWQNYGIASFSRTSAAQAPLISYYYLEEALRYQHPSLVVLYTSYLFTEYIVSEREAYFRRTIEPMRFSLTKLRLVNYIVSNDPNQSALTYLFPFLRNNARWNNLTEKDFKKERPKTYTLGSAYPGFDAITPPFPDDFMEMEGGLLEYNEENLEFYENIFTLCLENGIEVILVTLPRNDWSNSNHVSVQKLADEKGVTYLDYNLPENLEALSLDFETDFINPTHINTFGGQKLTRHLGAFIQEQYHLPDHRGDPAYVQWDIDQQTYQEEYGNALSEYQQEIRHQAQD
jgi:hypothetical protein